MNIYTIILLIMTGFTTKYDIILKSYDTEKIYKDIEKVFLEKFEYFNMIANHSKSNILEITWNNFAVMDDILGNIRNNNSTNSGISFDEYRQALDYLGCNISVFYFYEPSECSYSPFETCKTDAELSFFVKNYDYRINLDTITTYLNKRKLTKGNSVFQTYYTELVTTNNYVGLEYFLTRRANSAKESLDKEIQDLSFFENCNSSFSDKYPGIWWIHLLYTKKLEEIIAYINTLRYYNNFLIKYTKNLFPEEIADKVVLSFIYPNGGKRINLDKTMIHILPKVSAKLLEEKFKNHIDEKLGCDKLLDIALTSKNLDIIRRAMKGFNTDAKLPFNKYSDEEKKAFFDLILDNAETLGTLVCDTDDNGAYSYNATIAIMNNNTIPGLKKNNCFKFNNTFFKCISGTKRPINHDKNNFIKLFMTSDYSFLKKETTKLVWLIQDNLEYGSNTTVDTINTSNKPIGRIAIRKGNIILENYGHISILPNCNLNLYTKLNNLQFLYFANETIEKIAVIYNDKIKIYETKCMLNQLYYTNSNFYCFLHYHTNFEL